jgi:hypothetical protein
MNTNGLKLFFVFFLIIIIISCFSCKKEKPIMSSNSIIDMVIVFKKEIPIEKAREIMEAQSCPYKEGMDSSRGKSYFYKTGPKFIAKIDREEVQKFIKQLESLSEVYEVYKADWNIIKD